MGGLEAVKLVREVGAGAPRLSPPSGRRAIGFGAASAATVEDVLALIRATAGGLFPGDCLATLDRRAALGNELARRLGLDLHIFPADRLADIAGTVTPSARSADAVGSPSVAEAAALAALGPGARLTRPRRTGVLCTCALAELP
jgi:cobalt-precorrin 5A hydrolase